MTKDKLNGEAKEGALGQKTHEELEAQNKELDEKLKALGEHLEALDEYIARLEIAVDKSPSPAELKKAKEKAGQLEIRNSRLRESLKREEDRGDELAEERREFINQQSEKDREIERLNKKLSASETEAGLTKANLELLIEIIVKKDLKTASKKD